MYEPVSKSLPDRCYRGRYDLRPFPGCGAVRQKGAIFYLNGKKRAVYEAAGSPAPCGRHFFHAFYPFFDQKHLSAKNNEWAYHTERDVFSQKTGSFFVCVRTHTDIRQR